jgi:hypothetical protein
MLPTRREAGSGRKNERKDGHSEPEQVSVLSGQEATAEKPEKGRVS